MITARKPAGHASVGSAVFMCQGSGIIAAALLHAKLVFSPITNGALLAVRVFTRMQQAATLTYSTLSAACLAAVLQLPGIC